MNHIVSSPAKNGSWRARNKSLKKEASAFLGFGAAPPSRKKHSSSKQKTPSVKGADASGGDGPLGGSFGSGLGNSCGDGRLGSSFGSGFGCAKPSKGGAKPATPAANTTAVAATSAATSASTPATPDTRATRRAKTAPAATVATAATTTPATPPVHCGGGDNEAALLLQQAEHLVQVLLGNASETLTVESIQKVMQNHTKTETKKRYSSLLKRPWRTTPAKWTPPERSISNNTSNSIEQEEVSESNVYDRISEFDGKHPKMFIKQQTDEYDAPKRGKTKNLRAKSFNHYTSNNNSGSLSSLCNAVAKEEDCMEIMATQLEETEVALQEANLRIASLEQQAKQTKRGGSAEPSNDDDDDDDSSIQIQTAKPYGGVDDKSIDHTDNLFQGSFQNTPYEVAEMSQRLRLENTRSRALQEKITQLEEQLLQQQQQQQTQQQPLDDSAMPTPALAAMERQLAGAQQKLREAEEHNVIESAAMQAKIAFLEEELVYSEAKVNDITQEQQHEQLRSSASSSHHDYPTGSAGEQEVLLQRKEKELDGAKIQVAVANAAAQAAERKLESAEETHQKQLHDLQGQLTKSEEKTKFLHEELSNLMPLTTEMSLVKLDLQHAQSNLRKAEQELVALQQQQASSLHSVAAQKTADNERAVAELTHKLSASEQQVAALQQQLQQQAIKDDAAVDQRVAAAQAALVTANVRAREAARRSEEAQQAADDRVAALEEKLTNANEESQGTARRLLEVETTADHKVAALEEDLVKAQEKADSAARRLQEFEEEQRREQESLSEELRDAEHTIACLVEELDDLRPLVTELEATEQALAAARAKLDRAEKEIAGMTKNDDVEAMQAALEMSKLHVGELRSELDLFKPMAGDLKRTEYQLEEARSKLERSEQEVVSMKESDESGALRNALTASERELDELRTKLSKATQEQEHAELELQALSKEFEENSGALQLAKSNAEDLRHQLNLVKPLTSELERAVQELDDLQRKLDAKEQECASLRGEHEQKRSVQRSHSMTSQRILEQLKTELAEVREERDDAEQRVLVLHAELQTSKAEVDDLCTNLNLLKPLATDLENAEIELQETRTKLELSEHEVSSLRGGDSQADTLVRDALYASEREAEDLREELGNAYKESQLANQCVSAQAADLADTKVFAATLQNELDVLRPKLDAAELKIKELQNEIWEIGDIREEIPRLKQAIKQKEETIQSLNTEVLAQEKQINTGRMKLSEMEELRNYNDAKMMELSSLVDGRNKDSSDRRLHEKTVECAELIAERNKLKQKLNAVESMATTLEHDNKQKKELVQQLMKRGEASVSEQSFLEALQTEQDRTLTRCDDLSLQLAESQFLIDELTQKLRRARKQKAQTPPKRMTAMDRSASFSSPLRGDSKRSLQSMFSSGIGRMKSALDDDSVGGVSAVSLGWKRRPSLSKD